MTDDPYRPRGLFTPPLIIHSNQSSTRVITSTLQVMVISRGKYMIFMTQTKIILQHCMSGNLRKTHMRANNVLISAYQTVRFWVLCQLQKKSISVIGFIVGSDMQIGIFST